MVPAAERERVGAARAVDEAERGPDRMVAPEQEGISRATAHRFHAAPAGLDGPAPTRRRPARRVILIPTSLVGHAKPDLHRPGVARDAGDLARPRVLDVDEGVRRQVAVDVVEDVVGIEPQLQAPLRPQPEIPLQAEIHVPEAGPAHALPPRVPQGSPPTRGRPRRCAPPTRSCYPRPRPHSRCTTGSPWDCPVPGCPPGWGTRGGPSGGGPAAGTWISACRGISGWGRRGAWSCGTMPTTSS